MCSLSTRLSGRQPEAAGLCSAGIAREGGRSRPSPGPSAGLFRHLGLRVEGWGLSREEEESGG